MNIVSLDIETDTSPLTEQEQLDGFTARGLDPRITAITSIALATETGTQVFDDNPEDVILDGLVDYMARLDPTLVVTWNGAVFDLPFISDRAALYGIEHGINLIPNPLLVPKYDPTPGHAGGYSATWGSGTHIDVAYVVQADAEARDVKWSLKPYAQSIGLNPVEVDRTKMHELTPEQEREYVLSDAIVTLEIAKRALGLAW